MDLRLSILPCEDTHFWVPTEFVITAPQASTAACFVRRIWSFAYRGIKHSDFCCFKGVTYVALTLYFKLRSFFTLINKKTEIERRPLWAWTNKTRLKRAGTVDIHNEATRRSKTTHTHRERERDRERDHSTLHTRPMSC